MTEYRAVLDAEIEFVNGGGLRTEGFRLDLPSADLTQAQIGELLVRHLGLAMVGRIELSRLEVVEEAHKGSRGVGGAGRVHRRRWIGREDPGVAAGQGGAGHGRVRSGADLLCRPNPSQTLRPGLKMRPRATWDTMRP